MLKNGSKAPKNCFNRQLEGNGNELWQLNQSYFLRNYVSLDIFEETYICRRETALLRKWVARLVPAGWIFFLTQITRWIRRFDPPPGKTPRHDFNGQWHYTGNVVHRVTAWTRRLVSRSTGHRDLNFTRRTYALDLCGCPCGKEELKA